MGAHRRDLSCARIQLRAVETAYCDVTMRRTKNLDETLDSFESSDRNYRYTMAWIDLSRPWPEPGPLRVDARQ